MLPKTNKNRLSPVCTRSDLPGTCRSDFTLQTLYRPRAERGRHAELPLRSRGEGVLGLPPGSPMRTSVPARPCWRASSASELCARRSLRPAREDGRSLGEGAPLHCALPFPSGLPVPSVRVLPSGVNGSSLAPPGGHCRDPPAGAV